MGARVLSPLAGASPARPIMEGVEELIREAVEYIMSAENAIEEAIDKGYDSLKELLDRLYVIRHELERLC